MIYVSQVHIIFVSGIMLMDMNIQKVSCYLMQIKLMSINNMKKKGHNMILRKYISTCIAGF
jgi:hypothetical protein